jgi:hypothetical protein
MPDTGKNPEGLPTVALPSPGKHEIRIDTLNIMITALNNLFTVDSLFPNIISLGQTCTQNIR